MSSTLKIAHINRRMIRQTKEKAYRDQVAQIARELEDHFRQQAEKKYGVCLTTKTAK